MTQPLIVARRDLDLKLRELPALFRDVLGHPPREPLNFRSMPNPGGAKSYALVGRDEDNAIDLRDGQKPVVPITGTEGRFLLAVGLDWTEIPNQKLRFVRLQVLAFLRIDRGGSRSAGRDHENRQVFRLEWEGTNADGTFEAGDAGHPHWQIDVLSDRQSSDRSAFSDAAIDLREAQAAEKVGNTDWLQRMHLAALTDWDGDSWPKPFQTGQHARVPKNLEGLTSWMLSACAYVQQELRR